MSTAEGGTPLRIGAWARGGTLVGLVAAHRDGEVTLFDPAARQMTRVPEAVVAPVPAGAVRVTVSVDLPLAHGLDEEDVRRWVATLIDPVLRERAYAALAEAGLDEGAALPDVRVDVRTPESTGAICLCGARTPAPDGVAIACPACGRQAVSRPTGTVS